MDVTLSFPQHVDQRGVVCTVEWNVVGELRAEAEERNVYHTAPSPGAIHRPAFWLCGLWKKQMEYNKISFFSISCIRFLPIGEIILAKGKVTMSAECAVISWSHHIALDWPLGHVHTQQLWNDTGNKCIMLISVLLFTFSEDKHFTVFYLCLTLT